MKSFMTSRFRVVVDGAGNGTYSMIASSTGGSNSGSFDYSVNDDGSFVIVGLAEGFMLADGSVFIIADTDNSDNSVDIQVGVRK